MSHEQFPNCMLAYLLGLTLTVLGIAGATVVGIATTWFLGTDRVRRWLWKNLPTVPTLLGETPPKRLHTAAGGEDPSRLAIKYEDLWFLPKGQGQECPLAGARDLELINLTDSTLTIDVEAVWERGSEEVRVPAENADGKLTLAARGREILGLRFRVPTREFNARGRTWFLGADEALLVRDVSRGDELARIAYSDAERFRRIEADLGDRLRDALRMADDLRQAGSDDREPQA